MRVDPFVQDRSAMRGIVLLSALAALVACGDPKIVDVRRGISGDDGGPDGEVSDGAGGASGADGAAGESGAGGQAGQAGGQAGEGGAAGESGPCADVSAESLPARREVTTDAPTGPATMTVILTKEELFAQFNAQTCGMAGCHGGANQPLNRSPNPFKVTLDSFDQRQDLGDLALERVLSADPARVMPPGSGDGSTRDADNPLRKLAENLKAWQDAGFPDELELEVAIPEDPTGEDLPDDPYLLSEALAGKLTNIGSCLPDPAAPRQLEAMQRMDALFANAETFEDLPETLVETDFISLDSELLARRGVFSYAPTYTLFSDNASKMRYVRVPVGTSITFDEETGDFAIPENTRFYKTFLKPVTDKDGNTAYRKMETRLIVSRRDERLPDGSYRPRALRASYAWDKDEKMARLVRDKFRSGEPFADRFCPYVVDERVTRDPQDNPMIDVVADTCTYMTKAERQDPASGSIRHYAIPSSERCDQCHMGSSGHSYILGFNPWQVDRRKAGEGGVYIDHDREPSEDELDQLKRLIDYGVIDGIEPGAAKLEESQGERVPRNDHELTAQAYMMGNCAFCHNPHGFPTVQNPLLAPFNMFPDQESGGVFQFPLERLSPRARAGDAQLLRYPYITPAFGNFHESNGERFDDKTVVWEQGAPITDPPEFSPDFEKATATFSMLGPWRSLIWRNVYTPFTYAESSTIFIHMPRNVPDYDCRAHKIMASWMLSIPSVPKLNAEAENPNDIVVYEQPYEEVLPTDPNYGRQQRIGERRVEDFLRSVTGQHCPKTEDTIDPAVVSSPTITTSTGQVQKLVPAPIDDKVLYSDRLVSDAPPVFDDGVPSHAHWVPVDTTDASGRWTPRRSNWKSVVVTGEVEVKPELASTIDQINTVRLSDAQAQFSLEPQPMGLWHPECTDLSGDSPTVGELQAEGEAHPMRRWLFSRDPQPLARDARVHFQSRGEAVFRAICQNCHGRSADSKSPLSTTLLELTGGQTRVANFVDGLFGPRSAPGANALGEFAIDSGATPEEWQVRYLLFMTLGGTEARIPTSVVSLVSKSPFYGQSVQAGLSAESKPPTANMLEGAGEMCQLLLAGTLWSVVVPPLKDLDGDGIGDPGTSVGLDLRLDKPASGSGVTQLAFLKGNAHYELWESLCGFQNEKIVRVFQNSSQASSLFNHGVFAKPLHYRSTDRDGNWVYPPSHPVGNQRGEVQLGIQPDNTMPWCVERGSAENEATARERLSAQGISDGMMPFCPDALFATAFGQGIHEFPAPLASSASHINADFKRSWVRRGAMNAGIAAYYYLDGWTKGELTPLPSYDACRSGQ